MPRARTARAEPDYAAASKALDAAIPHFLSCRRCLRDQPCKVGRANEEAFGRLMGRACIRSEDYPVRAVVKVEQEIIHGHHYVRETYECGHAMSTIRRKWRRAKRRNCLSCKRVRKS